MENMNVHRSIVINGDLKFTNVSRVLQSKTFGKMITTFVNELEIRHSRKLKAVIPFRDENKSFDLEKFRDFVTLLNMKPLKDVMRSGYFDIQYGVDAVSYTHLDVYKRQALTWAMAFRTAAVPVRTWSFTATVPTSWTRSPL